MFLIFLLLSSNVFNQEVSVFSQTYNFDNNNSIAQDIKQCNDNGYIVVGYLQNVTIYGNSFLIFKIDSLGNKEWDYYNLDQYWGSKLNAVAVEDSIYVAYGNTRENTGNNDGLIIRFDSLGSIIWSKQYNWDLFNTNNKNAHSINFNNGIITSDTSLLTVGSIKDIEWTNPFILKTNVQGDTIWSWRLHNDINSIDLVAVVENFDGDYIAVGTALSSLNNLSKDYPDKRGIIVHINRNGDLISIHEWIGIPYNQFTDIGILPNNNLIISGNYYVSPPYYNYHTFNLITNNNGDQIYYSQNEYGENLSSVACLGLNNNDYLTLGNLQPFDETQEWQNDALLQKYSSTGELLFTRSIGGQNINVLTKSMITTQDNGIVICGAIDTSSTGDMAYIVKTDQNGLGSYPEGWMDDINTYSNNFSFMIYPNPVKDNLFIEVSCISCIFNIKLFNIFGKEILNLNSINNSTCIDLSDLSAGVYFVEFTNNTEKIVKKIIKN
jgi:hypothetical protein